MTPDLAALLLHPERVAELPPEAIPPMLCQLAALQSALSARLLMIPPGNGGPEAPEQGDRLLPAEEAAALLGVTPRWLYRHAKRLPFSKRLSRKALRFSEAGIQKWMATRRA
ncbi:MAG: helix-turn-helix domain-containing protein [Nitrospirales bacterium]